jgi:signal transduction histidine kinase
MALVVLVAQLQEAAQLSRASSAESRQAALDLRAAVKRTLEAIESSRWLLRHSRIEPRLSTVIGALD